MLTPTGLIERFNRVKGSRTNWESLWQECADYIIPRKNDITNSSAPGEKKYVDLFDSTAMTQNELLAGALHGMLTSPTGFFFGMTTGNPMTDSDDEVAQWVQDAVRKMHQAINNSNFQTEVHEYYLDLCAFGNGCLFLEEDDEMILRFSARNLKEVYVEENSKGEIDTIYRSFRLDARGLVDEFGFDNLPEKIQKQYTEGKGDKHEIIHCIYPRPVNAMGANQRFKFISQYVLVSEKVTLATKGFKELPAIFARWTKASGEVYGRGAGEKALPDAKSVNEMTRTTIRGAQKVVDPPLQAPDDGYMLPIITRPAGINFYRAGGNPNDRITPILNDSRIDFGFQVIDMKHMKIKEAFYSDQLKLREGPQMTAAEVNERVEQALRFLAPMLGRQQSEFLKPLVDRVFGIMLRRGMFLPIPEALKGRELKVQYSSIMAMTQRQSEVQNIQRTMSTMAPFISLNPEVADNFNGDRAARYIANLYNYPIELLNTQQELGNIRKAKAQQQQALQQAAQEAQQSQNVGNLAGAAAKLQVAK
jgi:hypothetical protein